MVSTAGKSGQPALLCTRTVKEPTISTWLNDVKAEVSNYTPEMQYIYHRYAERPRDGAQASPQASDPRAEAKAAGGER